MSWLEFLTIKSNLSTYVLVIVKLILRLAIWQIQMSWKMFKTNTKKSTGYVDDDNCCYWIDLQSDKTYFAFFQLGHIHFWKLKFFFAIKEHFYEKQIKLFQQVNISVNGYTVYHKPPSKRNELKSIIFITSTLWLSIKLNIWWKCAKANKTILQFNDRSLNLHISSLHKIATKSKWFFLICYLSLILSRW